MLLEKYKLKMWGRHPRTALSPLLGTLNTSVYSPGLVYGSYITKLDISPGQNTEGSLIEFWDDRRARAQTPVLLTKNRDIGRGSSRSSVAISN